METTGAAASEACPSWCTTDHRALINPRRPLLGRLKAHLGPRHKTGSVCVYGFSYPGHEPQVSVCNLLTGSQLVIGTEEARTLRELVQCLAKGDPHVAGQFESAIGDAIALIERDTGNDARGGGSR